MKNLVLAVLLVTGLNALAQTPRLSLYEEFTGETCPPCAATNPGLNALLALPTNTPKIVAIKWQVPIPSAPTKTWSLYQTNKTEIDWRYKIAGLGGYGYNPAINSAPSSKIDGQEPSIFGAGTSHPADLTSAVIAAAQSHTAAFSITMMRAWDPLFTTVTLTVNITASANFTSTGPLVFRTVMVEKFIHFATQPGTNGEKDFEDVAIRSFPTLQSGVAMQSNWTVGQTQSFTLSCPLPSYVRDKAEIAFVGFIQDDGNKKVAQAVRADPQMVSNDAKAISASAPVVCSSNMSPTITVKNNGSNTISSFDVSPLMNGTPGPLYSWSGSLAPGASTNIVLSNVSVSQGLNTLSYTISNVSGSDNNAYNNSAEVKFLGMLNYQTNPVAEGFTGTFPPPNFYTFNTYGGSTWAKSNAAGGFGLSTQSARLDLYSSVPANSTNELHIPAMHVGTLSPIMWFDVAYAQYTNENDKLEVLVSDNCGTTWTPVYSKAGAALATAPAQTGAFTPGANNWRQEIVSLGNYANQDILVKFVGTSDYGNNMYIDNINLKSCMIQTITASSSGDPICAGETATLTANGASSYSWSADPQATGAQLVISPANSQTLVVSSADTERCFDASASIVVNVSECTGIAWLSTSELAVHVYPNPSKGETSITIQSGTAAKARISVVNTLGQVVYHKQAELSSGEAIVELDVKAFAAGIYTIVVDTEKGTAVKKLTVHK